IDTVALETDSPVDDIVVGLSAGRLFVQAKRELTFGRPMHEIASQWLRAIRDSSFDPQADFIAGIAGRLSHGVVALRNALNRGRFTTAGVVAADVEAIEQLSNLLRRLGATQDEQSLIIARSIILERSVEEDSDTHAEIGRLLLDGHVVQKGQGGRAWRELV